MFLTAAKENGEEGRPLCARTTEDIGYTRTVQRSDGRAVTCYYFTTETKQEQHIAAAIWEPK